MRLIILFVILNVATISSQERLTDYNGLGTAISSYIQKVGDEVYLLETTSDDVTHVYLVEDIDDRSLLHKRKNPGFYNQLNPLRFSEGKVAFDHGDYLFYYDFVDNIMDSIAFPDGYGRAGISYVEGHSDRVHFFVSNIENNNLDCIYEKGAELKILESRNYNSSYKDHKVYTEGNLAIGSIFLMDFVNETIDTLVWNSKYSLSHLFYRDKLIYLDADGVIKSWDLNSNERLILSEQETISETSYVRIESAGDELMVSYVSASMGSDYTLEVVILDIEDPNAEREHNFLIDNSWYRLFYDNNVLGITTFNSIQFNDLSSGNSESYDIAGSYGIGLINDNYLLYEKSDGSHHIFDYKEFESLPLTGVPMDFSFIRYPQYVELNGKALLAFDDIRWKRSSFYVLDIEERAFYAHETFDSSIHGFESNTLITPFNSGLLLTGPQSISYFNDGEHTVLQDCIQRGYESRVDDKKGLYYISRDDNHVRHFDGTKDEVIYEAEFSISDLLPVGDHLYICGEGMLSRIDLINGGLEEITECDSRGLYEMNGSVLYIRERTVYELSEEGEIFILWTGLVSGIENEVLIRYQDGYVLPTDRGLSYITSSRIVEITIEDNLFQDWAGIIKVSEDGHHVLYGRDDEFYHFDGNEVTRIDLENVMTVTALTEDIFSIEVNRWDQREEYIYNCSSRRLDASPLDSHSIFSIIVDDDHHYLFSRERNSYSNLLTYQVSKTDSLYDSVELLYNFKEEGSAYLSDAHEGSRIMRLGHSMYIVDEDINISKISGINSSTIFSFPFASPEGIYFLASEAQLGRQLYRYSPVPLSIEDHISHEELYLFPNPTSEYLYLPEKMAIGMKEEKVQIWSAHGVLVSETFAGDRVDVSFLDEGIYFLKVFSEGHEGLARFVKANR